MCDLYMQDVRSMFGLGGKVKAALSGNLIFTKMFFAGKYFFLTKRLIN